ncbi:MAG TPA: AbrB/MazE/SpoVT family DNA-binding domain-containing protein [Stellaceae bacterium]|nr:AbrB/MazE/SpoVT family DNA-binding domain-containing protein [Stellaceae bacterium]
MQTTFAKISKTGRLSIPAHIRRAIGLERGGDVVVELDGRDIRIRTVDEAVARAQMLTRRLLGDNPDATLDAFLAERRREAGRE